MPAERRESSRRADDVWRAWLPLVLSLLTTLFSIGVLYGKLGGRLDLIEYRLGAIERTLKVGP